MKEALPDYRAVFISDTHLGFKGAQAGRLAHFLESHHSDHLYLVGDIIDGWRMYRQVYWPRAHTSVIQKLLALSENGTQVHYIAGNHDEMFRGWLGFGLGLGSIQLSNETEYYGVDGKRYLVIHGDLFDNLMHTKRGRRLMFLGTRMYDSLISLDSSANRVLSLLKFPRQNMAGLAQKGTKSVLGQMLKFEGLLSEHARANQYDGVICGHVHYPEIKNIGETRYMNCGDWIEHCTALVEHHDGSWELLNWRAGG